MKDWVPPDSMSGIVAPDISVAFPLPRSHCFCWPTRANWTSSALDPPKSVTYMLKIPSP